MSDLISRQAAIDALICKMRLHNNGDGTMTICVMSEGLVRETLNDLPSAEPEPHWIPCSERLPDGITQVIIQTNGEAIHEAFYMGKDDYGHYVWRRLDGGIYWNEDVVAWMPLPEPYRKEGEQDEID